MRFRFCTRFPQWMSLAGGPWLLAEPHGGDGNGGCVRCSGTNVRPSQWPLPSVSTTAHSARRRQGPGGGREAVHGQAPEAPTLQEPGTQHLLDDDSVPEPPGSIPCDVGANHRRLRHIGWEKCGHGLTSRPRESLPRSVF